MYALKRENAYRWLLPVLLAVLALLDLLLGGRTLSFREALAALSGGGSPAAGQILWHIRAPRMLAAILAGAGLALSGAQLQAVFRNPLADPHIMGVSAGAGTAAALATLLGGGTLLGNFAAGLPVAIAAFLGAVAATAVIVAVAARHSGATLLLFGVMLGFVFSALTSVLAYLASEERLKLFYSWSAGSFSGLSGSGLLLVALALAAAFLLALLNGKGLDILLFGDDYAAATGAPAGRIRTLALLSCCLVTGAVTAFCGPLGFVGIAAPHIVRWLTGSSVHRRVLPASLLTGAILCLAADLLSQCFPVPLPAGSTLALLGIPILLIILKTRYDR